MPDQIVKLNIGGAETFTVNKELLLSVKDSKLAQTFENLESLNKIEGRVFLDRDPEAFGSMIFYLRNNREFELD